MCNISILKKNQMFSTTQVENVCFNNWHSYGLVIKKDGKLEVIKKVPESGEIDPKEVYDLLSKYKDYERILHVRHNTAGITDLENCHPFEIYKDKKRHVEFMHNGTLHNFKSKKYNPKTGQMDDDDSGPSDTRNYVENVLLPIFKGSDFGNGKGDIESGLLRRILSPDWPISSGFNRGILISNNQNSMLLGSWTTVNDTAGEKIVTSNDDYFDKVTRGPEHTRRLVRAEEERREAREAKNRKVRDPESKRSWEVAELRNFSFDRKHPFFSLSTSPVSILSDWDFYNRESTVSVGYFSLNELFQIYEHKDSCLALMDYVFTDYTHLYEEYQEIQGKHERASKRVEELVKRVKELEEMVDERKAA